MKILLEDKWTLDNESDDIIEYANKNNFEINILTYDKLINYDSYKFVKCIFFCNTDIVQYHLIKLDYSHLVPNTYTNIFNPYYERKFEILTIKQFKDKYQNVEMFIKPYENNKEFDGRVIKNISDFELYGVNIPDDNLKIYCCKPLIILSEVRLLIGNNKLYGHTYMCKNRIDNYIHEISNLIENIINKSNGGFYCIDIGYIYENNKFKWIIIEINPPFSLDDYELDINDYMLFCIDSCKYIKSKIENTN
jgi:hypothetical protein